MNRTAKRKTIIKRWAVVFLVIFIFAFLLNLYMDARVGGGQRYRGSRSRGSRGRGGGGHVVAILLNLLIRHPMIGFPLLILILFVIYKTRLANPVPEEEYSSLSASPPPAPVNANLRDQQMKLLQQDEDDPNFSMPLFVDFCQLLYTNIITFAARQQLGKLGTYLSDGAAEKLKRAWSGAEDVREIIIGSLSITNISGSEEENQIKIVLQTNYTVKPSTADKLVTVYENAFWVLNRKKGVKSKGPGEINRFGCPSCGGALDDSAEGKCPYCGSAMDKGFTTWYLNDLTVTDRSTQAPEAFGGYAPEVGTDDPTHFQPGLPQKLAEFKQTYPDFSDTAFKQKVRHTFLALQEAWSTQNWGKVRPYETDQLFQVHLYWITLYRREQVRNILKDIKVEAIELVKIQKDAFYDAITVRIHAGMIDYTENYEGRHMGGDRNRPRYFTEYWTFIRRGGVKETDKTMDQCPNCGAALDIGMVGKCNYCDNKITTGEFNWVLSLIEQDESYRG